MSAGECLSIPNWSFPCIYNVGASLINNIVTGNKDKVVRECLEVHVSVVTLAFVSVAAVVLLFLLWIITISH